MDPSARATQPGLEVTSYDTAPEAIDYRSDHWGHQSQDDAGRSYRTGSEQKTLNNGYQSLAQRLGFAGGAFVGADAARSTADTHEAYGNHADYGGHEVHRPARCFPWFLVGLGGLVVFVLGGVIGGVSAWKITANRDQQTTDILPGAVGDTSSTNATKIMQNSALTALGWRYGADITLQLFFQGPDNALRRNFKNLPSIPQTELFYIGSPDKILGVNWREGFSRGGLTDSINDAQYTISNTGTQMAAYWPSTILQAANGDIMEVFYDYKSPRFQEPKAVGPTASPGSALVILPREVTHSAGDQTESSSARIVYRGTDGRLRNFDRSSDGQELTPSGQLPVTVDSNFTMAGFAVARLDTGSQKSTALNTWILYQDSKTGKISEISVSDVGSVEFGFL
ncbi:hypothetical protein EsH8_VI_001007 [Colletotrichum jinshuiense]